MRVRENAHARYDAADNQLQRADEAVNELAEHAGIITRPASITLASGDGDEILSWIRAGGISVRRER